MVSFKKLLRLANNKRQNYPPQIYGEILATLERERSRREKDLVRADNFYGRREREHTMSRLKRIEKMKSEVMKYV
jgi:hypothetical protein